LPRLAADGVVFALKQVSLNDMKRVDREEAIDEVARRVAEQGWQLHTWWLLLLQARMLSQLNHPYIIKHYDSFIGGE
jgi:hypothetical protein